MDKNITFFSALKERNAWYLIGLLPLFFGLTSYVLDITMHVDRWEFFWVCTVGAILTGPILLSRNRFFISAIMVWLISGPVAVILFYPKTSFQLWHFHHIASVIVLLVIFWHLKEIFNAKGFLFGLTSFYAYLIITSYLSHGKINMIGQWWQLNVFALYFGVFFIVISMIIWLWYHFIDACG